MLSATVLRRVLDVAVVLAASPVVVPLCLLLMMAIRLDSPGGALFVQDRVGRHRTVFKLLKLRTMAHDTGDLPSHEVAAARITRVGGFLRRSKLDELPQLWNVFRGEMTFVGPRPCLPSQAEVIAEREARELFSCLPGITGPAQIRNIDMAKPRLMAEIEHEYFSNASLLSDLRIVLQSVVGAGSGDVVGAR